MSIVVRPVEGRDRADIGDIYSSEAVIRQTGQVPHRGIDFWMEFYQKRDAVLELVAEFDGKVVGHLGVLGSSTPRVRHVANFGIAVHEDFHGRGIGSALVGEMVHLADNYLNLVRLELLVHTDNVGAITLYEKYGFEREGIARFNLFTEGKYGHGLRMARINPNYLPMLDE